MLTKYEMGLPVYYFQEGQTTAPMAVRIVGGGEDGSWGRFNGTKVYSRPMVSTPHGTVLVVGVAYLSDIDEDGLKKLTNYENELRASGDIMYDGWCKPEVKLMNGEEYLAWYLKHFGITANVNIPLLLDNYKLYIQSAK